MDIYSKVTSFVTENSSYINLSIAALLPVVAAAILYILDKKTPFGRLPYIAKQIIFGIVFGGLAIVGTEWGIPMNGAQANSRDSAVLIGGLMFGAPAGIIAGIIGGVERYVAVSWGVGTFTQIACSVSTFIAGIYAAVLRKYMFEDKKPGWFLSLAIGVVMEVFHLTMVFITNMNNTEKAMQVVKACTAPLIIANSLSVMIAAIVLTLLAKEKLFAQKDSVGISQIIQRRLLITVVLAFLFTSFFVYRLQDEMSKSQTDSLLTLALDDTSAEILDTSDANLLSVTKKAAMDLNILSVPEIAKKYNLSEVSLVNNEGIIYESTNPDFIGFNMATGAQSAEFLDLLFGTYEYVQSYGPISYDETMMRKYAGVATRNGFIQVGYDADEFQKDIDSSIVGMTKNRHVGNTGFVLILDNNLKIVSGPAGLTHDELITDAQGIERPEENTTFRMSVGGVDSFCRMRTSEGYYIVSVLPTEEALQMRNIALCVNSFMEVLVFAVLFALIYLLIKRVVVDRIKDINTSLAKITGGDLSVTVNVRTNEEFASLSDDINSTVDTLKHYIDEASARIDKELQCAKDIQSSALPSTFPAFPKRRDFDIHASMNPAKEVGGDFYDFYITDNDTLNFLIADVSGKGIPAAMFMMRAKTELKSLTESALPIGDVFTIGNAALCEGNDAGMFVTAWQGRLDLKSGKVIYANAGHNPPLVRHGDGKFEYVRGKVGFVLAGMDGVPYKPQEFELAPGDEIFLYTDGVTEATNSQNELFGEERLYEAINSKEFSSMKELCESVKADVDKFVAEAPQFDDITMVALKYIGTPQIPTCDLENATLDDIPAVTAFAEEELEKAGCSMKAITQFSVAIDELFSNIIKYGYKEKGGHVKTEVIESLEPEHTVSIRFTDEGIPYNPLKKEDPDVTLSAEERGIGGLGIFIVKRTMDDIKYAYENDQNILTITKKI